MLCHPLGISGFLIGLPQPPQFCILFARGLISSLRQQTALAISVPHVCIDHSPASPEQAAVAEAKQPEEVVKGFVRHKSFLLSSFCLSSSSSNSQRRLYGSRDGAKVNGSGYNRTFKFPDSNIPFFLTVSSASAAV